MTTTAQMKSMINKACSTLPRRSNEPAIIPQAQTEGPLVSTKPGNIHKGDLELIFRWGSRKRL